MEDRLKEVQATGEDDEVTEQSDYEDEEVKLRKDGEWSPKTVSSVVSLEDVLSVETKLESSNDIW